MKRTLAGFLFLALARATLLHAQTATPAGTPSPTPGPHDPKLTTQIYADEASFDTEKRIGIFTGHVRVFDPRFNIQSDKLTVYIHKQEAEGLEKAIATGHVGVVRDKVDPKGGPPSKAVGLSEKAVYTSSDGNVEMTGNPRVQQGLDTHIATSPDTVMILNENGQLTTHGPSRTEIRQEASPSPSSGVPGSSPAPRLKKPEQERSIFPTVPKKP
jgi:lipopolysaccharide transport protein LptA